MQNTAIRLAVVLAMGLVVHSGYLLVRSFSMPTEFRPMQFALEEMPMTFGDWKGERIPPDPKITPIIDADEFIDRVYRDPVGHQVSLHANAVMQYFLTLQHHPEHCYTTHGARIVENRDRARLELPDGSSIPVGLLTVETDGQRMLVLYWYQLDVFPDNENVEIVLNHSQQRKLRWKLFGKHTWPPLVKVLLQTPAMDAQAAEQRLMEFAAEVYGWTKYLDRPRDTGESPDDH